ncbi:MAG: DNA repair protein RecO [Spirochaetia bacterium]|nr:DNA repair protein RecO [Spirochaetia bacterium]
MSSIYLQHTDEYTGFSKNEFQDIPSSFQIRLLYNLKKFSYDSLMSRYIQTEGIILAVKKTASQHRLVQLLSPEYGIITATAYGAKKGKLTGSVNQFISGKCFLYYNPMRSQYKIDDIAADNYREYIRGSIQMLYSASFFAEILLKTYVGGGEYQLLYKLLEGALNSLSEDEKRNRIMIQFIWRYLSISGFISPDLDYCAECGRKFFIDDNLVLDQNIPAMVCEIHKQNVDELVLYPAARKYLIYTKDMSFNDALNVYVSSRAEEYLKKLLINWMDLVSDQSLNTVKSGLL